MRHVTQLTDDKLPRNAEFNIKPRAQALVDKWQNTHIYPSTENAGGAGGTAAPAEGVKHTSEPTKDAEVVNGDATAAPTVDVPMAEA